MLFAIHFLTSTIDWGNRISSAAPGSGLHLGSMGWNLVLLKGCLYFSEPQNYVSLMLSVGPPVVNRFKGRGQTKSNPKDPHEPVPVNTDNHLVARLTM